MTTFANGSVASIVFSLNHDDGTPIGAQSVSYALFDANDVIIINPTSVAGFVANSAQVTITIAGTNNALPTGQNIDSRKVTLTATTAAGEIVNLDQIYTIRGSSHLDFMVNSYQTLQNAEMLALITPNVDVYAAASIKDKVMALSEAYNRLGMLTFSVNYFTQNSVEYVTETNTLTSNSFPGQFFRPRYVVINHINDMTADYVSKLPKNFFNALCQAQLIEANIILGGDSLTDDRRQGMVSKKVGESATTWRAGKPLDLPVSRQALKALTGYIHYGSKLGRG